MSDDRRHMWQDYTESCIRCDASAYSAAAKMPCPGRPPEPQATPPVEGEADPEVMQWARRIVERDAAGNFFTCSAEQAVFISRALLATHATLVAAERERDSLLEAFRVDGELHASAIKEARAGNEARLQAYHERATAAEADAARLKSAVALAVEEMDDPCRQIGGGRVHFSDPCMAGLRAALSAPETQP